MTAIDTTRSAAARVAELRRTEFAAAAAGAYFNHASDSPVPRRAARVIAERTALLEDPGLAVSPREGYLDVAKRALGQLLGGAPEQIALLGNVSDTTATIANGLAWQPGDEVVVLAGEFASFVYPWRALERLGVRLRVVPKDGVATDLDRVAAAIGPRTRVVAISHVEYLSGYRNDLAALGELARRAGALFVVDASQSLGVLPVEAERHGIDAVVAVGYKWLMAPHGIGLLWVAPGAMERIAPTVPGRYSVVAGWETDDYPLDWFPDARRYQGGALNWIGVCALAESTGLLTEIGLDENGRTATGVLDQVLAGLRAREVRVTSDLDPAHRSAIVTFTLGSPQRDDRFVAAATARGVALGRRAWGVRIGAHCWNDRSDVERLLEAVDAFLGEAGR